MTQVISHVAAQAPEKEEFTNEKAQGNVLAIAEGSGAHSACFAEFYKNMTFQPSEYEEQQLKILNDNLKGWSNGCFRTSFHKSALETSLNKQITCL